MAPVMNTQHELNTVLTACMRGSTADGRPVPPQLIPGIDADLKRSNGGATNLWPRDRKFDHRIAADDGAAGNGDGSGPSAQTLLSQAKDIVTASKVVLDALRLNVAQSMAAAPEDIDVERPLQSFGVDSLKAVEVRNWIFRELKCNVSVFDILSPIALEQLSTRIAERSKLVKEEVAKGAVDGGNALEG